MPWPEATPGELGWQGVYKHDSPEVVALREQLQAQAGIAGLEVIDPAEEGYAERAARIFWRDGFVAVPLPRVHAPPYAPLALNTVRFMAH